MTTVYPVFSLRVKCVHCGYEVITAERVSPDVMGELLSASSDEMRVHAAEKHTEGRASDGGKIGGAYTVTFDCFHPKPFGIGR